MVFCTSLIVLVGAADHPQSSPRKLFDIRARVLDEQTAIDVQKSLEIGVLKSEQNDCYTRTPRSLAHRLDRRNWKGTQRQEQGAAGKSSLDSHSRLPANYSIT
jgi:hypothetical protein